MQCSTSTCVLMVGNLKVGEGKRVGGGRVRRIGSQ